jgi:xanthine dehydrogenase iron-sulfur cluster and FAD-binding subunit A
MLEIIPPITGVLTDIAGNDRIQNATVDMGAYEGAVTALSRVYVDSAAAGIGTGANWTDAYTAVQDAIDNHTELLKFGWLQVRITPLKYQMEIPLG